MTDCEQCPKLMDCHRESSGDLQIIHDLIKYMNKGFTLEAYENAEKLQRRIQTRHLIVTGRK